MATENVVLKLKRGSLHTLNNLLQAPGWYDIKTVYIAGDIVTNVMPEIEESPKRSDGKPVQGINMTNWLNVGVPLTLTQQQFKACQACIMHFVNQKQLPVNPYTFDLLDVLNLKPEDI